jgi:hypothetical protein
MRGSAYIAPDTIVYLMTGAKITAGEVLSAKPVLCLTPENYTTGIQVLDGPAGFIDSNNEKFDVSPQPVAEWSGPRIWRLDDEGKLVTAAASRHYNNVTLYYQSLQDAFSAAIYGTESAPEIITLLANIELGASEQIAVNLGHIRLTVNPGMSYTVKRIAPTSNSIFFIDQGRGLELTAPPASSLIIDGGAVWAAGNPSNANSGISSSAPLVWINGSNTSRGRFTLNGNAALQNNHNTSTSDPGGAVYNNGDFYMNGGLITGNRTRKDGGAVFTGNRRSAYISGGVIRNNYAELRGGAFMVAGDGEEGARLIMSGGELRDNRAGGYNGLTSLGFAGYGGAVFVSPNPGLTENIFEMRGGVIRDNIMGTSTPNGVAMRYTWYPPSRLLMSGQAHIADGVYLQNHPGGDCVITVNGPLNGPVPAAVISLDSYPAPGDGVPVLDHSLGVSLYADRFSAAGPYYIQGDGKLYTP